MSEELKEGDEVAFRGIIDRRSGDMLTVYCEVDGRPYFFHAPRECAHKVRPGTYEVTARDVTKMICRACRENKTWFLLRFAAFGRAKLTQANFKKLRRWVHCRLRELRRKRGGR